MKKLYDLKLMCEALGLSPTPTKHRLNPDRYELSVNDCVSAIQKHYVDLAKSSGEYTKGLDFMLKHKTPMLATLLSSQSSSLQDDVWSEYSDRWVFERKYNGVRLVLFYDDVTQKLEIFTRGLDDSTLLPINYINNFDCVLVNKIKLLELKSFVIDTELVFTQECGDIDINTYFEDIVVNNEVFPVDRVKFILLDCMVSGGEDITSMKYRTRKDLFHYFFGLDLGYKFESVETISSLESKEEFYYKIVDSGGEGVVVKDLDSLYEFKRSTSWLKIKPTESLGAVNLSDTLDAYVSGFLVGDNNLISTLLFSINMDNQGELINDKLFCKLPVSKDLSVKLTHYAEDGSIILNKGFYHHVAEFLCDGLNSNLEMIHPRLVVWRLDKSFDQCIYDSTYLSSLMIGV